MSIEISLNSEDISVYEVSKIPQLIINIHVENRDKYSLKTLGYTANLAISNVHVGQYTRFTYGHFSPVDSYNRNRDTISASFNITSHIFNAIERSRSTNSLKVHVSCEILCVRTEYDNNNNNNSVKFEEIATESSGLYYDLSLEKWHEFASKMGYKNYSIYEVSYSNKPLSKQFESVILDLNSAKKAFDAGDYKSTIFNCRLVLDEIGKLSKEGKAMKKELADFIDNGSRNPTDPKSKKINDVLYNIYNFMHIGPHSNEYPIIGREDAEFALTLCYSIVQYYSIKINQFESELYT